MQVAATGSGGERCDLSAQDGAARPQIPHPAVRVEPHRRRERAVPLERNSVHGAPVALFRDGQKAGLGSADGSAHTHTDNPDHPPSSAIRSALFCWYGVKSPPRASWHSSSAPVSTSQSLQVVSNDAVPTKLPLGCHAQRARRSPCPSSLRRSFPTGLRVRGSHGAEGRGGVGA